MSRLSRRAYSELYGPTTGDRVRLDFLVGVVTAIHRQAH